MAAENSDTSDAPAGFAKEQLRQFIERIERVEEEIGGLNGDKKDIYAEAKAAGFDVKVTREILKLRRADADARQEFESVLELYCRALGIRI